MNVLFVSSEVAPFAKVGGLGDVAGALPRYLVTDGTTAVNVVVPMYAKVHAPGRTFTEVVPEMIFDLGPHQVRVSIYTAKLPASRRDDGTLGPEVDVYFVRCPSLYDRPSIYGGGGDEHLRFAVLCHAALTLCQYLRFAPDIVHANDWQTGILPLLLKTRYAWDRLFANTRTVLTIHNIGHQGTFDARVLPETGLGDGFGLVHQDELRAGRFGFLLTGILHANAITTVSPTYAREIQTPEHGVGLDPYLRQRRDVLFGILNGIDENEWNPEIDPRIPAHYSAAELDGKETCKQALMTQSGLPYRANLPVVGIVSRLVWQKGFDLCMAVLPRLLEQRAFQLVTLGTGEPQYEDFFRALARKFPRQVAYLPAFSEQAAHLIEAGSDLFLMPSRYEPCGLNQMYSLRYGTLPIVHKTGGLADTVWNVDLRSVHGTGFVFDHFDESGLAWALGRALDVWGPGNGAARERWRHYQRNGMRLPLGWDHRVDEYRRLYRKLAPTAA